MSVCDLCQRPAVRTSVQVWIDEKVRSFESGDLVANKPTFNHRCNRHPFDPTPLRYVRWFEFDYIVLPHEWEAFSTCLEIMES